MGNNPGHARPGVVTIVPANHDSDDEFSVLHPEIDRMSSMGKFQPLIGSDGKNDASLEEKEAVDLIDAIRILNLTNAAKHETWSAHLKISENQNILLDKVENVEEHATEILSVATKRARHSEAMAIELKKLGSLSKSISECYSSLERAVIGLESLRMLLPENSREEFPSFNDFLANDADTN